MAIDKPPVRISTVLGALGVVALTMAFVDRPVMEWFDRSGIAGAIKGTWWAEFAKLPGDYWFACVLAVLLFLQHRHGYWSGWLVIFSGFTGVLNTILKWVIGRRRPFKGEGIFDFDLFRDGWIGLFYQKNLAFPSGHACTSFATATALAAWFPKYRAWIFGTAAICSLERVAENAHYASDVVAGATIGYLGTKLIRQLQEHIWPFETVEQHFEPSKVEESENVMVDAPYLSLVIPAYNEQESVPTLLQRVEASLNQLGRPYEVVIIDDGSTDQTPKLLADAMKEKPWLRVLRMQKNAGQSAAFEAGFTAARGELIATIDADLQNDPEEIPRLVKMLEEQKVDMITGWRKDRQDTNFRRWQSRQANRIRNWISQDTINDSASSLKLYRAHAIKGLKLFNGAHRFFPILVKMRGYKVFETPVKHSHRFAGTAKYGFRNRALRAFIDLLGIRWMKSRYLRYQADEVNRSGQGSEVTVAQDEPARL